MKCSNHCHLSRAGGKSACENQDSPDKSANMECESQSHAIEAQAEAGEARLQEGSETSMETGSTIVVRLGVPKVTAESSTRAQRGGVPPRILLDDSDGRLLPEIGPIFTILFRANSD